MSAPLLVAPPPLPARDRLAPRLRLGFRLLAIALCSLQAYTDRHSMNPDGIAYLDMATGDGSPNGYWSPLYPWLVGAFLRGFQVSPYWECAAVHAVNLGLFLVSLVAFEWLLSEVLWVARLVRDRPSGDLPLPDWAVVGVGYALFCFAARRFITTSFVTPDLIVAAAAPDLIVAASAVAACAALLRMRRAHSPWFGLVLGVVLGLGFLGKAVMFLMAFVFLAVSLFCGPRRYALPRLALGGAAFAAVAAIAIVPLSSARGRPTYGESGRLNYRWFVQNAPQPDRLETPSPVVVLPALPGTYSLWADPSLLYDSETPRFDVRAQMRASAATVVTLGGLVVRQAGEFAGVVFALVLYSFFARPGPVGAWFAGFARGLAPMSVLVLPACAGLSLYVLVGHIEERLMGPFLLPLGVGLLASVRIGRQGEDAGVPVAAALLTWLGVLLAGNLVYDLRNAGREALAGETNAHPHALVATALAREGLRPGDGVGSVGFTYNAYWARLARATIRAEVPAQNAEPLWTSSAQEQEGVWRAFRNAGADFVVTDSLPQGVVGWTRVPETKFAYRRLVGGPGSR